MNLYKTNMNLSRSHFFKQKKISQSREMASGCDFGNQGLWTEETNFFLQSLGSHC